ncbi:HAD domain-containing protein [Hydrogenophaga palleronii]|uniref:HAD domain-containing protein n=1 Tax=Hydrogenophaga palleronii TaxID=65655 RepID=UPI0014724B7A|nr:HAD domain-containing protein [Hydrogenophaga palleronii]
MFIDFDGVLHPVENANLQGGHFCWLPILVKMLEHYDDVRVVVHSSWRYEYTDQELRELLGPLGGALIGSAPRMRREHAIESVLLANKTLLTSHLVLDDDAREFTSSKLNLVLCQPHLGLSDVKVQTAVESWLWRTKPHAQANSRTKLPRGFGETILYLDYDGVLHHENVLWHPSRGAYAGPPGFRLFEHAPLLEELLSPYPQMRIVLSTAWVRTYGCYGSAKRLPPGLRARVIGATFHSHMDRATFVAKPRGQQVIEDVLRRCPYAWMALDDVDEGWNSEMKANVVITDERLGISAPGTVQAIKPLLERIHAKNSGA